MSISREIRLLKRLNDLEIELRELRKKESHSSFDMKELKLLKIRKKAVNAILKMQF